MSSSDDKIAKAAFQFVGCGCLIILGMGFLLATLAKVWL